jgi:hypothetical protein
MSFRWYAGNIPRNRFVSVLTLDAPTFIIYFGASKVVIFLSTSCKRLLSPSCTLNGQLLGRIHEGSECASAQPVLPRLAWRSTAAGDGGFCHGVCGAFSSSRRSRHGGQARMGMGRHHGVCGSFKFYYCFSPLMAETRASLPLEMTPFNSALPCWITAFSSVVCFSKFSVDLWFSRF